MYLMKGTLCNKQNIGKENFAFLLALSLLIIAQIIICTQYINI